MGTRIRTKMMMTIIMETPMLQEAQTNMVATVKTAIKNAKRKKLKQKRRRTKETKKRRKRTKKPKKKKRRRRKETKEKERVKWKNKNPIPRPKIFIIYNWLFLCSFQISLLKS